MLQQHVVLERDQQVRLKRDIYDMNSQEGIEMPGADHERFRSEHPNLVSTARVVSSRSGPCEHIKLEAYVFAGYSD